MYGQEYLHSGTGAFLAPGAYALYRNLSGTGHWVGQQQQHGQPGPFSRPDVPPRISEFPTLDQAVNDLQATATGQSRNMDSMDQHGRAKYQDWILEGLHTLKSGEIMTSSIGSASAGPLLSFGYAIIGCPSTTWVTVTSTQSTRVDNIVMR
jgi:hypothetical protein